MCEDVAFAIFQYQIAQGALRVSDNQIGDSPEARDSPRAKP